MKYELVLTKRTLKRLRKLNNPLKEDVLQAFDSILKDPLSYKALRYELKGYYSARVGKLRIIFRIEENKIIVVSIEHRKKVYKGLD